MLSKQDLNAEEESLRDAASHLPDETRKAFYQDVKRELKDPDTYAALNWFFVAGLHHFYLGRWLLGVVDLVIFLVGVTLLFSSAAWLGLALILFISVWELWALFRSQLIVQDWNNRVYRRLLKHYTQ